MEDIISWIQTGLCIFSPQEPNKDEFELSSMRCGRKLSKDGDVSLTHMLCVLSLAKENYNRNIAVFSVLLAMDRLQFWVWPAGDLHKPLYSL